MKITYSSDKINPFGGLSFVDKLLSNSDVFNLIDNELGSRSEKAVYSYADIIKSLWMITLSGSPVVSVSKNRYMLLFLSW